MSNKQQSSAEWIIEQQAKCPHPNTRHYSAHYHQCLCCMGMIYRRCDTPVQTTLELIKAAEAEIEQQENSWLVYIACRGDISRRLASDRQRLALLKAESRDFKLHASRIEAESLADIERELAEAR